MAPTPIIFHLFLSFIIMYIITIIDIIGLKNVETVEASDKYLLKKGEISPLSADDFAKHLKTALNYPVKYVGEGIIKNVLVCGGSGGNYYNEVIKNGCDALVTADVKHNHFLEAAQNGVALYDCGHFNTEVVVIKPLCKLLSNEFNNIEFFGKDKIRVGAGVSLIKLSLLAAKKGYTGLEAQFSINSIKSSIQICSFLS